MLRTREALVPAAGRAPDWLRARVSTPAPIPCPEAAGPPGRRLPRARPTGAVRRATRPGIAPGGPDARRGVPGAILPARPGPATKRA